MIRRDNVEYHAGVEAGKAGKTLDHNPYTAGGERAERWALGWMESRPMDKVHVIILGGSDADRARVRKVARLLEDPNEWDDTPPAIGSITAHAFGADAKHQIDQLVRGEDVRSSDS